MGARARKYAAPAASATFSMSRLFPVHKGQNRPFPKQQLIFDWLASGEITGGGAVYQGGKGSGKTIVGSAAVIWAHHQDRWRGMRSLIGRESYPSLLTSTADEFFQMVDKLPAALISGHARPSRNSMGWVEWAVGGVTLLCSLSNSDTWESANLGLAWVDEGHRQAPKVLGDLETRLRQENGPRAMIVTTNPAGKGFLWDMAHPSSPRRRSDWRWIEATSMENPALPQDYKDRLVKRYGMNTPAYKRWVLGQSTALEGTVFTEFDENPTNQVHIVPAFELPRHWRFGRGLDFGIVNPTAVVWGALDPDGNWWVDRVHYAPATPEEREGWTIARHAEAIKETDALYDELEFLVADPSIFSEVHRNTITGSLYSIADEFHEHGVDLTGGDNDREAGLNTLLDLISIKDGRVHPVTMAERSPSLFILDRECNEPLIRELSQLQWARPEGTVLQGRPDDVTKRKDHAYDALRYLVRATPLGYDRREPVRHTGYPDAPVGSRGQRRAY